MTEASWRKRGKLWEHHCAVGGKHLILKRSQMGIYKNPLTWNRRHIPPQSWWEIDRDHQGCGWCGGFPPELAPLVSHLRANLAESKLHISET